MKRPSRGTVCAHVVPGLLTAILVLFPAGITAQASADDDEPFRAWGLGGASWKWTQVAGRGSSLYGGKLAVGLTPTTLLGGAGFRLHGSTRTDPDGGRTGRRLDFGYGGVVLEHLHPFAERWGVSGSALAGAGHGTILASGGSLELGADNFGILELEVGPVWSGGSRFRASVAGGYRFAFGVQDLPGVTGADLRGATLSVGLGLVLR